MHDLTGIDMVNTIYFQLSLLTYYIQFGCNPLDAKYFTTIIFLRTIFTEYSYEPISSMNFILQDTIQTCLEQIEEMVQQMIEERAIALPNGEAREAAAAWTPPPVQDKTHSNATTPTDVRDVHF